MPRGVCEPSLLVRTARLPIYAFKWRRFSPASLFILLYRAQVCGGCRRRLRVGRYIPVPHNVFAREIYIYIHKRTRII